MNAPSPQSSFFSSLLEYDTRYGNIGERIDRAADIVARQVLRLSEGERVLIITNPQADVSTLSAALYRAAARAGAAPTLIYQPVRTQLDFTERAVIGAISSAPEVLVSMSARKLGKDREAILKPYVHDGTRYDSLFHYLLYGRKSLRSFWSPGITVDSFCRTVPIDYDRLKHESRAVKEILDAGSDIHITSPRGTDVVFSIEGRSAIVDDGDFSTAGTGGNIPAGETFISPVVGSAEGVIVFDGSIATNVGTLVLRDPIRVTVERGFVTRIEGGEEADRLRESIELAEKNALRLEKEGKLEAGMGGIYGRNTRNVGELGIGLNPEARITGNMLEDEKAYRTCHIAIGSNYDEDAPSLIHLDGLITEPTITARFPDGSERTFQRNGALEPLA